MALQVLILLFKNITPPSSAYVSIYVLFYNTALYPLFRYIAPPS